MRILEVKNLKKYYKSVKAVDNISFNVEQGDIFAFLGPNGAGKTTTLRILLDIIKSDSGQITWRLNGRETKLPDPSLIGYLPEERGLYTDLPVLRTLVYLGCIRGMDKASAKRAAIEWLERLQIADRAKEKLQTLSKGNQQKVQFIASIIHKPAFAILDEPFSGLDPLNQELFIEYIQELNRQGCTVILSSHQMQLVEKIAGKLLLINKGKELFNGSLVDIYKNHSTQHTIELTFHKKSDFFMTKGIEGAETVNVGENGKVQITFAHGIELSKIMGMLSAIEGIASISSQQSNLHDIYLEKLTDRINTP